MVVVKPGEDEAEDDHEDEHEQEEEEASHVLFGTRQGQSWYCSGHEQVGPGTELDTTRRIMVLNWTRHAHDDTHEEEEEQEQPAHVLLRTRGHEQVSPGTQLDETWVRTHCRGHEQVTPGTGLDETGVRTRP